MPALETNLDREMAEFDQTITEATNDPAWQIHVDVNGEIHTPVQPPPSPGAEAKRHQQLAELDSRYWFGKIDPESYKIIRNALLRE